MRNLLRRPVAALVVLVATGMAAGVAWATIPDGSGTIHACYSASDKSLRVVDWGNCSRGEATVSWGQNAIQVPKARGRQVGRRVNQDSKGFPGSRSPRR